MKKFLSAFLVILLNFLTVSYVTAGGSVQDNRTKIVIYTSMYDYVISAVQQNLAKAFPQYDVEFVYGGTGNLENRIATEQASGKLGCDMLMVAEPTYSIELKEKGLLYAYKSKEAQNLTFDYDKDGYWYPVRISNMVLAYNPEKYSKDSLPQSFADFANSASVKGAIGMRNPLVSGTQMASITALRDKYGYGYFDALGKQEIQIEYGSDGLITKLQSGEYKEVMILEESILRLRQENNSKLEVIYPTDGTIVIPSTIMIIDSKWSADDNTKAAEAITDWFLGPDGQDAIVTSGWMHSVRANFPKIPVGSISINQIRSTSMPVNWEESFRQRPEIQDRFQEALASR